MIKVHSRNLLCFVSAKKITKKLGVRKDMNVKLKVYHTRNRKELRKIVAAVKVEAKQIHEKKENVSQDRSKTLTINFTANDP